MSAKPYPSFPSIFARFLTGITIVAVSHFGFSQGVTGPNNVLLNSTHTYTYDDGNLWTYFNWQVVGGTVTFSGLQSGTTYYADVTWNVLGGGSVTARRKGIVLSSLGVTVSAPGGGNCATATVLSNENYVHTLVPRVATTNTASLANDEKIETVTYYDGLGRAKQAIGIRAGGGCEDIVTHIAYDAYGRQGQEYLPLAQSGNGGAHLPDAASLTGTFYNTAKYENTLNPYSEKMFEASPLNRVLKQAAPGNDWALGGGHEIEMDYQANGLNEVRRYRASTVLQISGTVKTYVPTLESNLGFYAAGELYKTITRDENHTGDPATVKDRTVEEFRDKQGQVVLKRTYNNEAAHDTYYVYDGYGNLTYVLPPEVVHDASISSTELSELCYQYVYDHRDRLVEKKLPGKGWEYILYDKLDRPVLTQDANQRLQSPDQWLFTKYDAFGRVAYTGTLGSDSSRTDLQGTFNGKTAVQNYEVKQATSGTLGIYYSNDDFPSTGIEVLTVNYYDNYVFDLAGGISETAYGVTPITNVKGLATGSKVRVLEVSPAQWTTAVTYYDDKNRPIYVYANNGYLNTTDKVKSQLAFDGTVTGTTTTHARTGFSTITTVDSLAYDHMNRLTGHEQTINGGTTEVIVENSYDELGQLISKGVGGTTAQSRLQTVDYKYNIRGWLNAINDVNNLGSDLFAFKINYNGPEHGATALYNGNIAETKWRTANTDNGLKWYRYAYDDLNRITSAVGNTSNYDLTSVGYDKNGNITTLQRQGHTVINPDLSTDTGFGTMDNLSYTYDSGNKLQKIADSGASNFGFVDGANTATEYTYDANGNMLTDGNKGITGITYNHLNLPTQVSIGGNTISYVYDATGVKLVKRVTDNQAQSVTSTQYAGNYVYEEFSVMGGGGLGNQLQFMNHSEGYVKATYNLLGALTGFDYVYQYKDHLGNIRLSYADSDGNGTITASSEIIEENNYYPFGLKHKGYNNVINGTDHPYGYLSQEEQNELGLNWLTFRYRNYMPDIGRFFGVDPVSSEYMSISTYQFAHNNPIWKIELEGLEGATTTGNGNDDTTNHEPVKVTSQSRVTTVNSLKGRNPLEKAMEPATKTVQKSVTKNVILKGLSTLVKGAGTTIGALLSPGKMGSGTRFDDQGRDKTDPNYPNVKPFAIDEKLRVDDKTLRPETDNDSPIRRFDDLLEDAKPGRKTKGKTKLFEKDGGFDAANEEFDSLNPSDIKEIETQYGIGRTGTLEDGTVVTVRPGSSDGRSTLERRNPENGRGTEIRYNN